MNKYFFQYQYALEKLSTAVRCLIVGEGDARSRVLLAYRAFGYLALDQFPPTAQEEYQQIINELTKRDPEGEWEEREWAEYGPAQANLRRMKNRTASKIAERIYNLQCNLQTTYNEWHAELRKNSE